MRAIVRASPAEGFTSARLLPILTITLNGDEGGEAMAAKSSKKARSKVKKVMHERKKGTLRSGSGRKVKSRKQAIAIGLAEARRAGAKVPKKKGGAKKKKKKGGSRKKK
jgi:uncharacterized protein DUF6496